jgi:hypothetical protein
VLAPLLILVLVLGFAVSASARTIPGPPLEGGPEPGAYCLPRGDGALGGAGFAGAVAALVFVASRRRASS